jgi:hypothetical protein
MFLGLGGKLAQRTQNGSGAENADPNADYFCTSIWPLGLELTLAGLYMSLHCAGRARDNPGVSALMW